MVARRRRSDQPEPVLPPDLVDPTFDAFINPDSRGGHDAKVLAQMRYQGQRRRWLREHGAPDEVLPLRRLRWRGVAG